LGDYIIGMVYEILGDDITTLERLSSISSSEEITSL